MQQPQPRILNQRFQLERKLGQGGMATVYLGRDLRLNRQVAIKILHGQYAADEQFLRRFKHEADSAAQLGHPNIVRVYDVGADGDIHYIVMEYIEGDDLKEIIDREAPLSVERTLHFVQHIADALEAAHRAGLVHRDIKPQNVIIDRNDGVHLTDFGIAKSNRSSAYTDPGTTFGTADYLAPEQAQGLGATPRSDVYALAVVMYEMLTGKLPFTGDTALAVAMQHIQNTPPPPRQFNPSIPPQLEAIMLQAMSKDPDQRPASARQFADLLRRYREHGDAETQFIGVSPAARPAPAQRPAPPAPDSTAVLQGQQPRAPRPAQPPRATPRPRPNPNIPPPLAQSASVQPARSRSGGCGVFVLGLLLLVGIGGLLYLIFLTPLGDSLANLFSGSGARATAVPAPTGEPTATVELVEVPQLVGLSEREALDLLGQLGLQENRLPPRNDPAPAATVIEQNTAPGTLIPKGDTVAFTLSLGPLQVDVPDVRRQTFDAAAGQLQVQGFQVTRVDTPNADVPAGFVISQNPPAGVRIGAGSTIELTVSRGDVVQFPPLIGGSRADAERILNARSDMALEVIDEQGPDRLPNFGSIAPNTVVSATANGVPIQNDDFVPRNSRIVLGVRRP